MGGIEFGVGRFIGGGVFIGGAGECLCICLCFCCAFFVGFIKTDTAADAGIFIGVEAGITEIFKTNTAGAEA